MANLKGREQRILDVSQVRDGRYKGAGFRVNEEGRARCSAVFSEWIVTANTEHGGTSPFPYGFYVFQGEPSEVSDLPQDLVSAPFLEVIPCDRPDRRAVKLNWSEAGAEAEFSFTALSSLLSIDTPKGTALWIDAIPVKDKSGLPVVLLPLGDRIKREAIQEAAAAKADGVQP